MPILDIEIVIHPNEGLLAELAREVTAAVFMPISVTPAIVQLGGITGIVSAMLVAGSALGPMPFGFVCDVVSSSTTILIVMAPIPFIQVNPG